MKKKNQFNANCHPEQAQRDSGSTENKALQTNGFRIKSGMTQVVEQRGRTLLETLATLSIIILLGVGVIKSYNFLVDRTKAQNTAKMIKTLALERQNTAMNDATASEITVRGPHSSLHVENGTAGNHQPYFWVETNVKESDFCQALKDSELIQADFVEVNDVQNGICTDNAKISFFFKKDKQGGVYCPANSLACNQWGDATTCKDGYYLDHGVCSACPEHVATCEDENTILTCQDGYEYLWGNCIEAPNTCTVDTECSACGDCDTDVGYCKGECQIPTPDEHNNCGDCFIYDYYTNTCQYACTRVRFLRSTGAQYINTGITISANDEFIARYIVSLETDSQRRLSGYSGANSGYWGISSTNVYELGGFKTNISPAEEDEIIFRRTLPSSGQQIHELLVNKSVEKTAAATRTPETGDFRVLGLPGASILLGKIYHFDFKINNIPVRDFTPVLAPDGEPCMFDRVTQKLFCNAGSGIFQYGN